MWPTLSFHKPTEINKTEQELLYIVYFHTTYNTRHTPTLQNSSGFDPTTSGGSGRKQTYQTIKEQRK